MPLAPPGGACDDSSRRLIEVGRIEGKRRPMSVAEAYAALADLHPRVASEMLAALREAGIAAYATPKSDLIDSMVADGRPDTPAVSDRLYVDASMKSRAEQILASRLPQFSDGFAGESSDDGRVSAVGHDRDRAGDGAAEAATDRTARD